MGGSFSGMKNGWAVFIQNFPPKPQFSVDQIPDLSGRIALVTGTHLLFRVMYRSFSPVIVRKAETPALGMKLSRYVEYCFATSPFLISPHRCS